MSSGQGDRWGWSSRGEICSCGRPSHLTSKTSLKALHLQGHRVVLSSTLLVWTPPTASWPLFLLPLLSWSIHSLHSSLSNPLTTELGPYLPLLQPPWQLLIAFHIKSPFPTPVLWGFAWAALGPSLQFHLNYCSLWSCHSSLTTIAASQHSERGSASGLCACWLQLPPLGSSPNWLFFTYQVSGRTLTP